MAGLCVQSVKLKILFLFDFNQLKPLSIVIMVNIELSGFFTT